MSIQVPIHTMGETKGMLFADTHNGNPKSPVYAPIFAPLGKNGTPTENTIFDFIYPNLTRLGREWGIEFEKSCAKVTLNGKTFPAGSLADEICDNTETELYTELVSANLPIEVNSVRLDCANPRTEIYFKPDSNMEDVVRSVAKILLKYI